MVAKDIVIFFGGILVVLFMYFIDLLLGSQHDCYFKDDTIRKLTVPKESILRKIVIFKELKMTNPPFLYIRVIPYLIQFFVVAISTILFFVDQFAIYLLPDTAFLIISYASLSIFVVYELLLIVLSRGLKL